MPEQSSESLLVDFPLTTVVDIHIHSRPEYHAYQPGSLVPVDARNLDPYSIEPDTSTFRIKAEVIDETVMLQERGIDVTLRDTHDPQGLEPDAQQEVSDWIENIEQRTERIMAKNGGVNPNIFYQPSKTRIPAINNGRGSWNKMLTTAAALHPLYHARDHNTLGQGINTADFTTPIILAPTSDGTVVMETALEGLSRVWEQRVTDPKEADIAAVTSLDTYLEYIPRMVDPNSRKFFQGCIDGRAIRTRAEVAKELVTESLDLTNPDHDFISVSLACGAATPVYSLVKELESKGVEFSKIVLADVDPLALASAHSLADNDTKRKVELHRRNLLRGNLTEFIEPESADVVDVLGLFEYLPDRMAARILQQAAGITRPGGVIVFGNMLDERPEQTFFKYGVKWPKLFQRSLSATLQIVENAGFAAEDVSVAIPAHEGTYAVVAIRMPEESESQKVVPLVAPALGSVAVAHD